jgi:alkanesulfonate monooxygenase SsuD/methylene tetrahydromethanopterin reductase-like flavin-dependent oxidoreductase (luciferase family)
VIKVGLDVHDSILGLPPEASRVLMRRAAALGLDYLVVGDHVSFHGGHGFDGIVSATLALAAHPTLPVLIGVYQLALRHPLAVARQLSSIAQVAPGRLVLGVGAGGEDRQEIANAGIDPSTRGRRLDESLQVLRLLATGRPVDFDGGISPTPSRSSESIRSSLTGVGLPDVRGCSAMSLPEAEATVPPVSVIP